MNPIQIFKEWYSEELSRTTVRIPAACCLSTEGLDHYPDARFVSLKEVLNEAFVVTGPLQSRKGREIKKNNKVALTFWWAATERQVRIQGEAYSISDQLADKYFSERTAEAQIVSSVSQQGENLEDPQILSRKYAEAAKDFQHKPLERPPGWGGFSIHPVRMEFMEFQPTRFHDRKLFQLKNRVWSFSRIQP